MKTLKNIKPGLYGEFNPKDGINESIQSAYEKMLMNEAKDDSVEIDYLDLKSNKRKRKKFKTQKAFDKWMLKYGGDVHSLKITNEAFYNKIRGSKVPIGDYTFKYTVRDVPVTFVTNSADNRKIPYEVTKKTKNSVWIKADARLHNSLINSFQSLDIDGMVSEKRRESKKMYIAKSKDGKMLDAWTYDVRVGGSKMADPVQLGPFKNMADAKKFAKKRGFWIEVSDPLGIIMGKSKAAKSMGQKDVSSYVKWLLGEDVEWLRVSTEEQPGGDSFETDLSSIENYYNETGLRVICPKCQNTIEKDELMKLPDVDIDGEIEKWRPHCPTCRVRLVIYNQ